MTTLTTTPLAPLLDRLFEEADATSPFSSPAIAALSPEEQERLMRSKTDYLDFYERLKDFPLPVSRGTGTLLYMLARSSRARTIVEFGTSFGISTLYLAAALRDNGGGHLITSEFETLSVDLPETIDLLLLDGAKALYPEILSLVESRLRSGSLIIADNAEYCPDYLAHVREPANGYLSTPFAEDVELSMRIG